MQKPELLIALAEPGDNSVNFCVRPWVKSTGYFRVMCSLNEAVKKRFGVERISIPYQQRHVYICGTK